MEKPEIIKEALPKLSLCIPTNGISEWVFPVLDSIYEQCSDDIFSSFEVIVMDNGDNEVFCAHMKEYAVNHSNLSYYKTDAFGFLSEPEMYKKAKGNLIKFVNHRTKLVPGALKLLIGLSECYQDEQPKPIVYFTGGVIAGKWKAYKTHSFDKFIKRLSYWSSWSTGMTIWKDDFETTDLSDLNILFPHTNILFAKRDRSLYIVDNRVIFDEIPTGTVSKGKYNLFNAFAVEYIRILEGLYRAGDISKNTLESVKKDNLVFMAGLYRDFVIDKKPCSYDLTDIDKSISVYYSMEKLKRAVKLYPLNRFREKCIRAVFKIERILNPNNEH